MNRITQLIVRHYFRLASLACAAALCATVWSGTVQAATVTWDGADGSDPTFWDIATTANWDGSTTTYTDGDDVIFNDTGSGSGTTVALQTTVSPTSVTINTSSNAYLMNSGDIAGATSIVKSGSALTTFTQDALSFSGGTQITGSGDIAFNPTGAGPHSFGTGTIELNNSGAAFIYTPAVASSSLSNNFEINAAVTWDRAGNSGVRTGTVTVNNDFTLRSDGASGGIMEADMILTGDRQITGGRFGSLATIPQITGDVSSSGGPHTLTIRHTGQNPDWRLIVGDSTSSAPSWDVQNLIRASGAGTASRSGTLDFNLDERIFFDTIEANGGRVVLEGSTRFLRSNTVEVEFDMIFNENNAMNNANTVYIGSGFKDNDQLNIQSGGLLGGNGIIRHRNGLGAAAHNDPTDVDVFAGGTISPGDYTLGDTTDVLTVNGDVNFNGGSMLIEITGAGATPGVDHDQLAVTDSNTPSGSGVVTGLNNLDLVLDFSNLTFSELDGDVITILTSTNDLTGGSFNSVTSLNLEEFLFYDIVFGNGSVSLQNFQSIVPEPGSMTLMGLGLLFINLRRRRQRAKA